MDRKRQIRAIVGYLLSALCVAVLAARVDWPLFVGNFKRAPVLPLIFAASLSASTYIFFALRWRLLLDITPRPHLIRIFAFLMMGYSTNALLPMRAGDALRVVLVHKKFDYGIARALSTVLVERVFDLFTLLAYGVLVAFLAKLPNVIIDLLILTSIVAVGLIAFMLVITIRTGAFTAFLQKLTRPLGMRVGNEIAFQIRQFAQAIDGTFSRDRPSALRLANIVCMSFLGWGAFGSAMIACTWAFGLEPAIASGLLLMVVTNLGSAIRWPEREQGEAMGDEQRPPQPAAQTAPEAVMPAAVSADTGAFEGEPGFVGERDDDASQSIRIVRPRWAAYSSAVPRNQYH